MPLKPIDSSFPIHALKITSSERRRARTRSLIQIGGLVEKAGLLEDFGIILGEDLQKSPAMKEPIAGLFKGFLDLGERVRSGEMHLPLSSTQGLAALKTLNKEEP